ncbi:uncharacterized protein LTR77_007273 [Saxophila tyrrhenica]|uniref:Very-long-chain (3R)-3-hydroxyacyl-CoA dehydratase n=1 Tax=Saxophila tyrrhenica TaxID=1690608 RepID=A0AAV9P7K1_9PEZI|nr:hypothetical protein LTR77_007273 [Saxophila tyrrhenica]
MDRPSDSQKPSRGQQSTKTTSSPKSTYLLLYNLVSSLLWFGILLTTATNLCTLGPASSLYPTIGTYTKYVQTLAALEILHSLLGLVRAPLLTTIMQVASRFLLVWGVVHLFPHLATDTTHGGAQAYRSMLLAWSFTEVVRYGYFVFSLSGVAVPGVLKWLRYNGFWVLYPLGIGSECWLVGLAARGPGRFVQVGGVRASWVLWGVLGVYVPGSYVLFTHMMKQRARVMRGDGGKKTK